MVSYCSLSNDRLLTKRLIEVSTNSFKSFHNFVNTSEWTDELDLWTTKNILEKKSFSKRNLIFSENLRLYLPRDDRTKSSIKTSFISSTNETNQVLPKRLKQLFKKEKDLFKEIYQSNQHLPEEEQEEEEDHNHNQQPNLNQSLNFNRIKSTVVRHPLRHVQSSYSRNLKCVENIEHRCQSSNQEKVQMFFKEQLNQVLTKETIQFNCKGTLLRRSSKEKQFSNKISRTTSAIDSTSIMERYTKVRQVLISPTLDQTTNHSKSFDYRQSPIIFQGSSTLGLTVTPLLLSTSSSSSKTLQNSSLETINQQENRPLTHSVSRSNSTYQMNDQRILSKRHIDKRIISSSENLSNRNSFDDQTLKNFHRHHRPPSKTQFQKTKISQLLPKVISEKCLLIPVENHRYY